MEILNNKYYSPLRYPGGKSCIFPFMSKLFYENDLIGVDYAEPYAGGAGLALKLLIEGYVNCIYINDLDPSIYAFWDNLVKFPDALCNWIDNVEVTVDNWHYYKNIQCNRDQFNSFELAKSTLFLNRTNVSGIIKGGMIGGYSQNGKYKIDARFNKFDLINRIQIIKKYISRIIVSNEDGINFLHRINQSKLDCFFYIDPPYYQKGSDLYMNFFREKDHRNLCKQISHLKKRWIVSYDDNEFILGLYRDKNKVIYQLSQCASNRIGDEVLIFSPNVEYDISIKSLKSPIYCK